MAINGQLGFFDLDERYQKLSEVGNPLMRLKDLVDFGVFRPALAAALKRSDGATEFQIRDRFSFMRFFGLELHHAVPDAKTILLFCEQLAKAGAVDALFESFDGQLKAQGFLAMFGRFVETTIVAAPRQRNSEDEKKTIKEGRIPDDRKDKPKKLAQKDLDAR